MLACFGKYNSKLGGFLGNRQTSMKLNPSPTTRESHFYILPNSFRCLLPLNPPHLQHCRIASRLVVESEKDVPENVESRADHQSFSGTYGPQFVGVQGANWRWQPHKTTNGLPAPADHCMHSIRAAANYVR
jgi:hypothetical protein